MVSAPSFTVTVSIIPSGIGGVFTVTATSCPAESPPGSLAVKVIVASPATTPVIVASLPSTVTVATPASELAPS